MKLPPVSRKASYTFRASSLAEPQPQSSPKVMVPSAASETRSPLLPNNRYRIDQFSLTHDRNGHPPSDLGQFLRPQRVHRRDAETPRRKNNFRGLVTLSSNNS